MMKRKDHEEQDKGVYVEDGEVEEEADAVDADTQDGLQLTHHGAGVLQGEGQVLAVLVHRNHGIPHVLYAPVSRSEAATSQGT